MYNLWVYVMNSDENLNLGDLRDTVLYETCFQPCLSSRHTQTTVDIFQLHARYCLFLLFL